jgi:hypothetical protein
MPMAKKLRMLAGFMVHLARTAINQSSSRSAGGTSRFTLPPRPTIWRGPTQSAALGDGLGGSAAKLDRIPKVQPTTIHTEGR